MKIVMRVYNSQNQQQQARGREKVVLV
jgi:hypothetical protein